MVFVRLLSATSPHQCQWTSARDGPHVGTHVCTPLKLYLYFQIPGAPSVFQLRLSCVRGYR